MAWRSQSTNAPPASNDGANIAVEHLITRMHHATAADALSILGDSDAFLKQYSAATGTAVEALCKLVAAISAAGTGLCANNDALCRRFLSSVEVFSSLLQTPLNPRQLDDVLGFLKRCLSLRGAEVPTFRCLGRVVFSNAERCSKWLDVIVGGCVAELTSRRHSLAYDVDIIHAALVALGNSFAKAGAGAARFHATAVEPVLGVLSAATVLPASAPESVDHVGRLLSSGLRVLLVMLQSEDSAVRDAIARNGDELLRTLHYCSTFGVTLEQQQQQQQRAGSSAGKRGGSAGSAVARRKGSVGALQQSSAVDSPTSQRPAVSAVASDASSSIPPAGSGGSALQPLRETLMEAEGEAEPDIRAASPAKEQQSASTVPSSTPVRSAQVDGAKGRSSGQLASPSPTPLLRTRRPSGGAGSWYSDSSSEGEEDDDDDEGDNDDDIEVEVVGALVPADATKAGSGVALLRRPSTASLHHPRRIPIRVRVTALHCLACLAKGTPRVVLGRLGTFIPEVQGTHPRPFKASLLTVLLYDPSTRVREAAAAALGAVMADAPFSKWVASTAAAVGGAATPAGGAAAVSSTATAVSTADNAASSKRGGARPGAPSSTPGVPKPRAFSSLSDKTVAMIKELHAGLERALQQHQQWAPPAITALSSSGGVPASFGSSSLRRRPVLLAAMVRAAAVLVSVTPYERLPPGLANRVCARTVEAARAALATLDSDPAGGTVVQLEVPRKTSQIVVAALHFCGAVLPRLALGVPSIASGTAASAVAPILQQPPIAIVIEFLAELTRASMASLSPSSSASTRHAQQQTSTLLRSVSIPRTELAAVLSKAARAAPSLLALEWASTLSPFIVDCLVNDETPVGRCSALRLLEEILRARAVAVGGGKPAAASASSAGAAPSSPATAAGGSSSPVRDGKDAAASPQRLSNSSPDKRLASAIDRGEAVDEDFDEEDAAFESAGATSAMTARLPSPPRGTFVAAAAPASTNSAAASSAQIAHARTTLPAPWDAVTWGGAVEHASILFKPAVVPAESSAVFELVRLHVCPALSDASAPVRAGATVVLSYLLPDDWEALMGRRQPSSSVESSSSSCSSRDALLAKLVCVGVDSTSGVRTAACRVWGAYAAFPQWRSPAFMQLAAHVLLALSCDDSVAVRTKAVWALGNLCDFGSLDDGVWSASAQLQLRRRGGGSVISNDDWLFSPTSDGTHPLRTIGGLSSGVVDTIEAKAVTAVGVGEANYSLTTSASADVHSPLELYGEGLSQSALVSHLSLPLLRQVCHATIQLARGSNDRIAGTAIRAMGYCVRALLLHWLPLPVDMRHVLDPIVVVLEPAVPRRLTCEAIPHLGTAVVEQRDITGGSTATATAVVVKASPPKPGARQLAELLPRCPDDALVKQSMLLIADVVASSVAEGPAASHVGGGTSAAAPSGASGVKAVAGQATTTTTATAAAAAAPQAALPGPKSRGPAVFSSRRPTGGTSSSTPIASLSAASLPDAAKKRENPAAAAAAAAAGGKAVAGGGAPSTSSAPAATSSAKVRWNACRAVGMILPLMHRISSTHSDEHSTAGGGRARSVATTGVSSSAPTTTAAAAAAAAPANKGSSVISAAALEAVSVPDLGALLSVDVTESAAAALSPAASGGGGVNSPVRPRVRRDSYCGSVTQWAGVDHVSTARSPFVPRTATATAVVPPPQTAAATVGVATSAVSAVVRSQGGLSACPRPEVLLPGIVAAGGDEASNNAVSPAASASPAASSPPAGGHGQISAASAPTTLVTDATHPTVAIDASWCPPLLSALQIALLRSDNFKVRIAGAQSLALVPSRASFRLPGTGGSNSSNSNSGGGSGAGVSTDSMSSQFVQPPPQPAPIEGTQVVSALLGWSTDHLSPALQQPGYDAFPPALLCLLSALETNLMHSPADATETKYRPALLAAIRGALLHLLRLTEKLDYGRMKPMLDAKAGFLLDWLVREGQLLDGGASGVRAHAAEKAEVAVIEVAPSMHAEGEDGEDKRPAGEAAPSSHQSLSDVSLGHLSADAGITADAVREALESMTALYSSRVKTIPASLLQRYRNACAAATEC